MVKRRLVARLMQWRPVRRGGFRILLYHSVAPDCSTEWQPYTVHPEQFGLQMEWLAREGCLVLPLSEALRELGAGQPLPPRTVVLSFDDGYKDNLEYVAPIVARYGFRPIIFVCPALLGGDREAALGLAPIPRLATADLAELERAGWEVGAHSMSHRRLIGAAGAEVIDAEVGRCRRMLRDLVGSEPRVFAYPFGQFDDEVRRSVIRYGFEAACSGINGYNTPRTDSFALRRISVFGDDDLAEFARKVCGAYDWLEGLDRRRLRRAVAAGRGGDR